MDPTAQQNPTPAPTPVPKKRRVIVLEPADAGPDVKPVRQRKPLTEAQKAALQRGRERLAERRKQMKEEHEGSTTEPEVAATLQKEEKVAEESEESDQETEADEYDEVQSTAYCSLM